MKALFLSCQTNCHLRFFMLSLFFYKCTRTSTLKHWKHSKEFNSTHVTAKPFSLYIDLYFYREQPSNIEWEREISGTIEKIEKEEKKKVVSRFKRQ